MRAINSAALSLDFQDGALYTTSMETGPVSASGAGTVIVEPNPSDPGDQPELPNISLSVGAGLIVQTPNTQAGSIIAGSVNQNNGTLDDLYVGQGTAPDGTLNSSGNVVLGTKALVHMYIDGAASSPPTPTPSTDYTQIATTGSVTLGDATLMLGLGTDSDSDCDDLVPGQVYTLISAGTISGELDYNGSPIPDGQTMLIFNDCDNLLAPSVRINYNTSSTPETVTATVVSGGHAGDLPMLTGASPVISGTPPVVGFSLQASSGFWSGDPTSYDYDWYSCSASAGPDCDNKVGSDVPDYTPAEGDVGDTIEVCVSATNSYGTSTVESCSDPTAAVTLPAPPTNTGSPPGINGTDQVGDTLTANPGSWSSSPTFTYQWQLCQAPGASCTNILGATSSSYTLTNSDMGQFVRVEVTATNAGGATVGYSSIYGQVTEPTAPSAPATPNASTASSGQVKSALSAIAHPSGRKAIAALLKSGFLQDGLPGAE